MGGRRYLIDFYVGNSATSSVSKVVWDVSI